MRLGFAVKVWGRAGLKESDNRRWQNHPHLSVSLAYLRDVLVYLETSGIRMYRMSAGLAPYLTHPDLPQFHGQLDECETELAFTGRLARDRGIRLSFHPCQYVVLNTPDEARAARGVAEINALAGILDRMEAEPEAVVVVHVGGVYGNHEQARTLFARRYEVLPPATTRRLALEHDDTRFGVADTWWIHQRTGIPLVFDNLHHANHNPEGMPAQEALALCLSTWPQGVRPKVHFSCPRTEMRVVERRDALTGRRRPALQEPIWTRHSDYVNPFEFIAFGRASRALGTFDVMVEAKAKDLAVLRLRADLHRFAPDLAGMLD
jgi:UV DNA damage endonuclease